MWHGYKEEDRDRRDSERETDRNREKTDKKNRRIIGDKTTYNVRIRLLLYKV